MCCFVSPLAAIVLSGLTVGSDPTIDVAHTPRPLDISRLATDKFSRRKSLSTRTARVIQPFWLNARSGA